eukprot:TRINITY_DN3009_c0_g1_i1.p1 TRINITY_DN3009_c0_g1~~TRINITY_DN3009_c0_g1_i1.p1  ORF type:complete len:564 (-),score=103.13 TRINITY_DN3009_c0_g1_i1:17-1708(-)
MSEKKIKVLVTADVQGKPEQLFKKIADLNKSNAGPFDVLFCVGSFFGGLEDCPELDAYISGEKKVPIETYFITTAEDEKCKQFQQFVLGGNLCDNLFHMGKQGMMEIKGLQVVYVSGTVNSKPNKYSKAPVGPLDWKEDDIAKLITRLQAPSFKGADILLSNAWSQGILSGISESSIPTGISLLEADEYGAEVVARVAVACSPRYHFARTPKSLYYERPPYANGSQFSSPYPLPVTRFYSIASAFNTAKQKFLYAFNTSPMSKMPPAELFAVPPNATDLPFAKYRAAAAIEEPERKKQKFDELEQQQTNFFFTKGGQAPQPGGGGNQRGNQKKGGRQQQQQNDKRFDRGPECWFCLSNPKIEKHLIISIGEESYVALAKGPINEYHVLIVPLEHISATTYASEATTKEMNNYKNALTKFFASKGMDPIIFERNVPLKGRGTLHTHLQVMGVPQKLAQEAKRLVVKEGQSAHLDFLEFSKDKTLGEVVGGEAYVYFETPQTNLVYVVSEDKHVPLQFGRRVLARLIDDPEREDWKAYPQTVEQESAMTSKFKQAFVPFDFTLQE